MFPKRSNMQLPILRILAKSRQGIKTAKAITKTLEFYPEITTEDYAELHSCGKSKIDNLVRQVRRDLKQSGFLAKSKKGIWKISAKGKKKVKKEWRYWLAEYELSAQDKIENKILFKIMELPFYGVEKMMCPIMKKLGNFTHVKVTNRTNDNGFDLICWRTQLQFDKTVVQVKRFAEGTPVDRPSVQKLVGVRLLQNAVRAVFITTSHFSEPSRIAAEQSNVMLIDGSTLAKICLDNKIGVKKTGDIVKLDLVFFNKLAIE